MAQFVHEPRAWQYSYRRSREQAYATLLLAASGGSGAALCLCSWPPFHVWFGTIRWSVEGTDPEIEEEDPSG